MKKIIVIGIFSILIIIGLSIFNQKNTGYKSIKNNKMIINSFWKIEEYKDTNLIYRETWNKYWQKYEYNNKGQIIYREDSDGLYFKWEFDNNGNIINFKTGEK